MQNPDIFAGTIISSGANFADSNDLSKLLGNSIRNYYGGDDESNLSTASNDTQVAYVRRAGVHACVSGMTCKIDQFHSVHFDRTLH